jgi:alkylation response protein AidB-like acyl-CoA dehydrogenase
MALIINEEQQMLKQSAKDFLKEHSPISALRTLRDTNDANGYDTSLWHDIAEMGWSCLTIAEEYGGLGFGYVGLGQVLEETGRLLVASPLVATVLLGTTAINLGGSDAQKAALLPEIAEGKLLLALATEESNAHRPYDVTTSATANDNGFSISGKKKFVLDGHVANTFIVSAKTANGFSLFLVPADADGISVERHIMMDSRNAATVTFDNVQIHGEALLGADGEGQAILEKTLDIGRIGLCAEMLGLMLEAYERTIAYLKERKQFGVTIGSFQALQHRAANMFCEIELCKSLVLNGLQAIDAGKDIRAIASMTKAKVGQIAQLVSNEGIQMYGGIGMTDEEEIGWFMKRSRVAQQTLGGETYHLNRFAILNGF